MSRNPFVLIQSPPRGGEVIVTGDEAHHLISVLRAQAGYEFTAFDGAGYGWQAEVVTAKGKTVIGRVKESYLYEPPPSIAVTVAVGVVKGQRMDYAVEKAAETGTVRFIPLLTDFGVITPGKGKSERWQAVALAAAKQSRRMRLMEVTEVRTLKDVCLMEEGRAWALVCGEGHIPIANFWRGRKNLSALTIVIGPEGGYSDPELSMMREMKIPFVTLGSHPLRTETATAVVTALIENFCQEETVK